MMKRILILILVLSAVAGGLFAADTSEDYYWGGGLSVISPGLPVAAKIVYQRDTWGWQGEANYFYLLGMLRFDGRAVIKSFGRADLYGFAGVTLNHFNGFNEEHPYLEFILSADVGGGADWRFTDHLSVGVEGGLLIPFWCNRGLDQFDNSGLMVANLYMLYWF